MNDDACKVNDAPLTQGIRAIKTSPSTKSVTADKFTTKDHKKQCRMLRSL